jgi:drug/metabolite transporter (DMT)-like permease
LSGAVTTLASILLLGETLTLMQAVGAGLMIVSLCAFQFTKAQ